MSTSVTFNGNQTDTSAIIASGNVESPNLTGLTDNGYVVAWSVDNADFEGMVVNRYAANGDLLKSTQIRSNDVDDPSVTALPNGQFILAWSSENDATHTSTVYTQRFDANGNKSGSPVVVTTSPLELEDAKVTVLSATQYIVTWGETHESPSGDEREDTSDLKAVVYTNNVAGTVQTLATANPADGEADDMTVLPTGNGSYWLAYSVERGEVIDATTPPTYQYTSKYLISQIGADGKVVTGTAKTLDTVTSNYGNAAYFNVVDVTGGYVVSWVDQSASGMNRVIHTQRYDSQFNPVGTPSEVESAYSVNGASITSLPNGGYLLAWNEYAMGEANVYVQRFAADGTASDATPIKVATAGVDEILWDTPAVTVRDDGTISISWETGTQTNDSPTAIYLQNISSTGELLGVDTTVDTLNNVIIGDSAKNTLTGAAGNDTLDGGAGVDKLSGGAGDDTYLVDLRSKGAGSKATVVLEDTVLETANKGSDTLKLRMDTNLAQNFAGKAALTLGANLENLDASATGKLNIGLTGNALVNRIVGSDGDNLLDGKAGIDTLIGGKGNDTYLLDNVGELALVQENANEGTDTLKVGYVNKGKALTIDLNQNNLLNFENVTVAGAGLFNLTGNAQNNILIGNMGNNTLSGGAGDDVLDGKKGVDTLKGGTGNDTYYVYSNKDVVIENASEGTDTVRVVSYLKNSYTLAANVENAIVDSKAAISLTGNALSNTLTGNDVANTLNGGLGVDTLIGGKGNDTYVVDNAGDSVIENVNQGADTVNASIDYVLGANIENLTLLDGALNGTGNALKNTLIGNTANNTLDGGAGVDKLVGGAGNDTYIVDLLAKGAGGKATVVLEDTVIESAKQGVDTLALRMSDAAVNAFQGKATITLGANLENLDARATGKLGITLTGNAADNTLWGNTGNNTLNGGVGNDTLYAGDGGNNVLIGGTGADTLYAGSGVDTIKFNALKELGLNNKQDVVHGFTTNAVSPGKGDKLDFSALKGYTFIGEAADFSGAAKELRYVTDGSSVTLYGTSNADHSADFSIKLVGVTALTAADLVL